MKNNIRISGGNLRGKKIPFEYKVTLRPTSNKLKEILFNWLQFEISDSNCLDLFAGTGSLGIEALSRDAKKVMFVELNKTNYTLIAANIKSLDLKASAKVLFKDAFTWVRQGDLSEFDFIFLDPPFNKEYELKMLNLLVKKGNLKPSCKIYLEHSKYTDIEIPKSLEVLKEKSVGDVKALLLKINEN